MATEQTETRHPTHAGRRRSKDFSRFLTCLCQRCSIDWTRRPEEERHVRQGPKRLRSTFTIPQSDSARAWAPHGYDNAMGIGPVSYPSERDTDSEKTNEGRSAVDKSLKGSDQNIHNLSGADESSWGYDNASLAEAIDIRHAQLEVPAACASQGATDRLRERGSP